MKTSFLGKTQIKQWLKQAIKDYLKSIGYKIVSDSGVFTIIKEDKNYRKSVFFNVHSNDEILMSAARFRINKVEEIIYEITQLPVYTSNATINIMPQNYIGTHRFLINTYSDIEDLAIIIKSYFEQSFLSDFEKYSDLNNVLALWDSLETPQEKGVYFFDTNNYSKILIISKMCKDERFEERVEESLIRYRKLIEVKGKIYEEELNCCERVIKYLREHEV